MAHCTFGNTNVFFYFPKFDKNRGSHWMHFCLYMSHRIFRMFAYLQIYWQPFYLHQLLKFHQFDWLNEIYLQTEGQGTHHKMVSLQPMPGFPSVPTVDNLSYPLHNKLEPQREVRISLPNFSYNNYQALIFYGY